MIKDEEIQALLHQYSKQSFAANNGSFAHCAGVFQALLLMLLTNTITPDGIIDKLQNDIQSTH